MLNPPKTVLEIRPTSSPREEGETLSPELQDLAGKAVEYHESALSENPREAYQRGWEDFLSFCDAHGLEVAPTSERAAGLPQAEDYKGHFLLAGHITQASMEGAPDATFQAQSRHESDRAFREYVRLQKLLENTSSAHLEL